MCWCEGSLGGTLFPVALGRVSPIGCLNIQPVAANKEVTCLRFKGMLAALYLSCLEGKGTEKFGTSVNKDYN